MTHSFNNYCEETTLHGFKHFSNVRVTQLEKWFWFVSLVLSLISCVVLVTKLVIEIQRTPIMKVSSNKPVPIVDIPFPAITFCQEVRIQESDGIYNFLEDFYYGQQNELINASQFVAMNK